MLASLLHLQEREASADQPRFCQSCEENTVSSSSRFQASAGRLAALFLTQEKVESRFPLRQRRYKSLGQEVKERPNIAVEEGTRRRKMRRKSGGDASAKGGEDDQECRRECCISSQNHKANDVEERSTDLEERGGRRENAGTLRSKHFLVKHWQCNEWRYRIRKTSHGGTRS